MRQGEGFLMRRAFTLVELLIVIAVILILMSLSFTAYSKYRTIGRVTTTKAFLSTLKIAAIAYEENFGKYPPDEVVIGGKTYKGTESLVYHFTTAFRILPDTSRRQVKSTKDAGPYMEMPADNLKDLDGDGLPELVDAWGQPIQYDNIRDDEGNNGFDACINDPRADGQPRNFESFDLWSPGVPGKSEPIANFAK